MPYYSIEQLKQLPIEQLKKDVSNGDAEAEFSLGYCYYHGAGQGIEKNIEEAVRLFKSSAAKKNIDASACLGNLLLIGWGVTQDVEEGIRLLEFAAGKGHKYAALELGKNVYYLEKYQRKDETAAYHYLKLAEKNGCHEATTLLAARFGSVLFQENRHRMLDLKNSDKNSPYSLAFSLAKGFTVDGKSDCDVAYELIADLQKKNPNNKTYLTMRGWMLYKGFGTKKLEEHGKEMFEKSKSLGGEDAENMLKWIEFKERLQKLKK